MPPFYQSRLLQASDHRLCPMRQPARNSPGSGRVRLAPL